MKGSKLNSVELDALYKRIAIEYAASQAANEKLRKAQLVSDRADRSLGALREQYDVERLHLWGDNPDVKELLKSDTTTALYQAGETLAKSWGLGFGMKWADTNQTVLHIQISSAEAGEATQAAQAVRFFAPHLKSTNGFKRFSVNHHQSDSFALELHYSLKTKEAELVRKIVGEEVTSQSFESLKQALSCIEAYHWFNRRADLD